MPERFFFAKRIHFSSFPARLIKLDCGKLAVFWGQTRVGGLTSRLRGTLGCVGTPRKNASTLARTQGPVMHAAWDAGGILTKRTHLSSFACRFIWLDCGKLAVFGARPRLGTRLPGGCGVGFEASRDVGMHRISRKKRRRSSPPDLSLRPSDLRPLIFEN